MDQTSRPAAPSELPIRSEDGAGAGATQSHSAHESGLLPYLPVPRHRRPTETELAEEGRLAHPLFIRITILFTILFVMAMTALIWYRWYPVALPTSSIVFLGDESLDGAVATIKQNGQVKYTVTIDKGDGYTGTVWLSPGRYELDVTRNDQLIQRTSILVGTMQSVTDTLSNSATNPPRGKGTTTQPATSSGPSLDRHI